MKQQLIQLMRIIQDSAEPITSSTIADILDISPRSVKNYIQEINVISADTIFSSHSGYTINKEKARDFLKNSESTIPQTSNERVAYIINRILKNGHMNSFDLCDEIYISYSTLKTELRKVRRKLSQNDLELIIQNDLLIVNGLEKNKRKLLSTLLYDESRNNFVNYKTMSDNFHDIDVEYIKNTMLETFNKYHYFVNDYSLENLVLHVTITIDRIKNGYLTNEDKSFQPVVRSHEHELAVAIIHQLENHFGIFFNDTETSEFTLLILSRASNLDYETITAENLKQYIGEDVYNLTGDIIKDFTSYFYIDLSQQPEFFVRFALHIKNVLIRANSNYFSKNPMTGSIKQNCPLIYDAAVNAAQIINERTGIYLNDDEIAYIAFHLGGALEMQTTIMSKISATVFCPDYYHLNSQLSSRISSHFNDRLIISNILTTEENLTKVNSDLIISTMKTDIPVTVPLITVTPFISEADVVLIGNTVDSIRKNKKKSLFSEHLSYLIKPELFDVRNSMNDKSSVIHKMTAEFKKLGYVKDTYEEEVIERDRISSTAFGTFAIPHAMKMHEYKTGMNIMILNSPVDWDGHEVYLIMMLCFNRNERYIFNEVFEPISMILTNRNNMKQVLEAKSAEEFIHILADLME
jgi:lichenan operon transcriptional antiterminator